MAEIAQAEASLLACHLANVVQRLPAEHRRLKFDLATQQFRDGAEADEFLRRDYRSGFDLKVSR